MRSRCAPLRVLGLGLIIASCVGRDLPTGTGGEAGLLSIAVQPALIPSPADGTALPINRIRVVVSRIADGAALLDTRIDVSPTAASWTLDLSVPLPGGSAQAEVLLFLLNVDTDGTERPQFSGRSLPVDLAPGPVATNVDVDFVRGPLSNLNTTSVSITSAPSTLAVGATAVLQATATADPSPPLPAVFWTSLEPALLSMTGPAATGIAVGTARVVASAGTFADTVSIDVFVPPVDSVAVAPDSADVAVGATRQYTAELRDAGGGLLTGRTVTWSTGNPSIATVGASTGVVTGVAPGTTTVTATSEGVSDQAIVRVPPPTTGGGGGATITWTRGSGGLWSDASAWSLNRIPQAGDTVRLTQGVDYLVTLDVASVSIAALVIGGTADVITLDVGNQTLNITGTGTGAELDILPLGGLVIGSGTVTAADVSNQGSVRGTGPSGRLIASTFVSSASITVASGGALELGHSVFSEIHTSGAVTVDPNGLLILGTNAQWSYAGGAVTGGGIVSFAPGSELYLEADLAIDGPQIVADGAELVVSSADRITLGPSSTLSLLSLNGQTNVNPKVVNQGVIYATGPASYFSDSLYVEAGGSLLVDGAGSGSVLGTVDVVNAGSIVLSGAADATFGPGGTTNRRILNLPGGEMVTLSGGGTRFLDGQLENQGSLTVMGPTELHRRSVQGAHVGAQHLSSGNIQVIGGELAIVLGGASPTFTNAGTMTIDNLGTVSVTNVATPAGAIINAATGVLEGTGTVRFNPGSPFPDPTGVNNGIIAPGLSPGILTWQGQVPMGPTGVIELELGGPTPGAEHDQLNASADLILDLNMGAPPTGSLVVTDIGYAPTDGDRLPVMTFRSRLGNFASVTLPSIPGFALDTVWAEAGTVDTLFIVATATGAPASLNSWINPSGGNWSVGANWSKGVPPVDTDSVAIDLDGTYVVTLDTNPTVAHLTLGASSGIQTLTGSFRTLVFHGTSTIGPNGRLTLARSNLVGAGLVTNQGVFTISGPTSSVGNPVHNAGTIHVGDDVAWGGALTTSPSSVLRIGVPAGNAVLTVANGFTNHGTVELTSTSLGYSAQLAVTAGTLVNSSTGVITSLPGTGGSRTLAAELDNQGVVDLAHPLTIDLAGAAHLNSGVIDVNLASLTLAQSAGGSFTNTGSVQIDALRTWVVSGGTLDLDQGSVSGGGTLGVSGATFEFLTSTVTTPMQVVASTIPGGISVPVGETLTLLGGSSIAESISNAGTIILTGAVAFNGPLSTAVGSTLRLGGVAGHTTLTVADGFTNNGTLELTSTSLGYSAQLNVLAGTLVNLGTLSSLPGAGGSRTLAAELDNQGTLTLSHPLTLDKPGAAHKNSVSISVDAASLTLTQAGGGSFTNTGAITVSSPYVWTVTGGTLDIDQGTVSGTGTLDVSGGATLSFTTAAMTTPLRVTGSTIPGGITVPSGESLTLLGGTSITEAITNSGTIELTGTVAFDGALTPVAGSTLRLGSPAGHTVLTVASGFTNDGTIELTSTSLGYSAELVVVTGKLLNSATGTLRSDVGGGGSRTLSAELFNLGSLLLDQPLVLNKPGAAHVNGSVIDVAQSFTLTQTAGGTFTNDGSIDIVSGRTWTVTGGALDLAGTTSGAGTLDVSGGATLTFSPATTTVPMRLSGVTITGGLGVGLGETLTLLGGSSIDDPVTNAGTIVLGGAVAFNAAVTSMTGTLIVGGVAGHTTLTVASGFTNQGTIELTSTSLGYSAELDVTSGTLLNSANGVLGSVVGAGGARTLAAELDNQGTLLIEHPLVIDEPGAAHVNASAVDLAAGLTVTQSAGGSFTDNGAITIGNGFTWTVTGGVLDLSGTVNGPGTLDVSGGAALLFSPATTTAPMRLSGVSIPGGLTVGVGQTLTLLDGTSIDDAISSSGTIVLGGAVAFNGALTTVTGSTLRIGGLAGHTTLTVANGFSNGGVLDLTSTSLGYSSQLLVTSGTLTNAFSGSILASTGAGGARTVAAPIDNSGVVSIQQSTTMTSTVVQRSSLRVFASYTLTIQGQLSLDFNSITQVDAGATLDAPAGCVSIGGGPIFGGGTYPACP